MKPVLVLAATVAILTIALASPRSAPQAQASAQSERLGHDIFVQHCAKCHDENAVKPLPDGTNLLQRLAKSADFEALLSTRLKKMNEPERQGVKLYVGNLLRDFRSSSTPKTSQSAPR
jgi:mono/diheme cytochrome c family protein